ncbi:MAG: hypothetical protein EAZ60_16885 [Oscillatoriales cyanobacterium]|nr:MAG: hypothetical protein EAZ60_16885 [Oscillatoriales cyanobacterium]
MQMAKVLGTVVSTQKEPTLRGSKFLLLQFINEEGSPVPGYEVAADCVGAGIDEWVLVTRGSGARIAPSFTVKKTTRTASGQLTVDS